MNSLRIFLVDLITAVIFRLLEKLKLRHVEGKSDGKTEDRLKDKLEKDGWL